MLIGKVPKQESHAETSQKSIPPPVPPRVSSLLQKSSQSTNNASTNLKPPETPLPSQCSSSQGPQPPPIPPKQQPPPIPPKHQNLSAINAPPLASQIRKISAPPLPLPQGHQANALSLPPKLHQSSLTTQSPPIPPTPSQSQVSSLASLKPQLDPTATALQEKKDPSSLKPIEGSMSLEYITMKEMLADLVDLLAGNAPVISQLNNHLFSSDLIPKAVHVTVETTGLTPYDRTNKLFSSVLATLEYHPNPNSVFSSLITALQKVGLNNMVSKLMENLSKI